MGPSEDKNRGRFVYLETRRTILFVPLRTALVVLGGSVALLVGLLGAFLLLL